MYKGKKVIVVEDDDDFRLELCKYLSVQGLYVYGYSSVDSFKEAFKEGTFDVALIDKNIGFDDGFELISFIRKESGNSQIPIMIISALGELQNRLDALRMGADDFLEKPVQFPELEQRIYACFRRAGSYQDEAEIIRYHDITINLRCHQVMIGDQVVDLTPTEYKILVEVVSKVDQIHYREQLVAKFLSSRNSSSRTLDVHINSLRKKLGPHADRIQSVRGRGYIFRSA